MTRKQVNVTMGVLLAAAVGVSGVTYHKSKEQNHLREIFMTKNERVLELQRSNYNVLSTREGLFEEIATCKQAGLAAKVEVVPITVNANALAVKCVARDPASLIRK
jgi:hypothetical protein